MPSYPRRVSATLTALACAGLLTSCGEAPQDPAARKDTPVKDPVTAAPVAPPVATKPLTPAEALAKAPMDHPRLFAHAAAFRQAAAATTPAHREARDRLTAQARLLQPLAPLTRKLDGRRLLGISRAALLRIGTLGAVYRLDGDAAAGQAAKTNLLAVVRFTDWNPSHFLDVAEMTLAVSLGYDWCYDLLTDAERLEVRTAIISKGLEPSFAKPDGFWIKGTNNWSQVCHGGLLAGALAIHEHAPALARQVVERAVTNLPRSMDAMFDPSGNYPEGPMYWSYGTHYNLVAIEALRSVLGSDFGLGDHVGLRASGLFVAHTHGATGQPFCYGDCSTTAPAWTDVVTAQAWLARENRTASLLPRQPALTWKPSTETSQRFLPFLPLWLKEQDVAAQPLPLDYRGTGLRHIATFRSAWNDPQATYLGVTGGSPGDNHAHQDTGSFVFESGGIRWADDLGMHTYNPLEQGGVDLWNMAQDSSRWQVLRLSQAVHNVLVLPGGTQQVKGRGLITDFKADATTPGCTVDLTSIYRGQAGSVTRTLRLPGRKALEVEDRVLRVTQAGTVRWQLVTRAQVTPHADQRHLRLTQDGRSLEVTVEEPAAVRLVTTTPKPTLACETAVPGVTVVGIETQAAAGADVTFRIRLAQP